jgi:lipopolysaccharide export system protein LptA
VPSQLVTIGGNVVLTQGFNTIKGDRLVIDLKTGLSRFENATETAGGEKPKQRLRAIFSPNGASTPKN